MTGLGGEPDPTVPPGVDHTHDLRTGGVDQAEGGDVRPAVLEVLQVDQVQVEVGDQVVVVGGHHSHRLRLLQHRPDLFVVAVQDDVDFPGLLHLLEDRLVVVVVLEVELLDDDPGVVLVSGGVVEQLLKSDETLVVLRGESSIKGVGSAEPWAQEKGSYAKGDHYPACPMNDV